MRVPSSGIPEGYRVEETNERVGITPDRVFFRWRAERLARRERVLPSYHLRVEKVGRFLYEVVPYQNRLVKI